jgi:hypothetical protein
MFKKTWLYPMESHNPDFDILCGRVDEDTFITYGLQINGPNPGEETMEIYKGENYNVDSKLRSWSRHYAKDAIPKVWKKQWLSLRFEYRTEHARK